MRSSIKVVTIAAVVGALQIGAWLAYRTVESRRVAPAGARFTYEPASGIAPGQNALLELSHGGTLRISERVDEALLVHFWASWCAPCRTELPTLLALSKQPNGPRPSVLLVSVDENWETIRHFFGGQVPPEVVRDAHGELKRASAVSTLPETLVVAPGGELKARVRGPRDWTASAARDGLNLLLSSTNVPAKAP